MWKRVGTGRQDMEVAGAGDIVSLTGAGAAAIADTIGGLDREEALSPGPIEPPTLRHAASDAVPSAAQYGLRCDTVQPKNRKRPHRTDSCGTRRTVVSAKPPTACRPREVCSQASRSLSGLKVIPLPEG